MGGGENRDTPVSLESVEASRFREDKIVESLLGLQRMFLTTFV